ncbi:hypothetical protein C8R47DRAFT_1066858 [Mycena vitilis]|nr:hypothetical protein C8R47DRAFT_1066858 [Mycena vitilis]
MRFSTFVLFASAFAASLATPAPQTTASIDSLTSQAAAAVDQLTHLTDIGSRIAALSSTPTTVEAVYHMNGILSSLVPTDLLSGILGGLLGSGLGGLLNGESGLLSGLLSSDALGGLLGGVSGNLLGGLLGGSLGSLLGGNDVLSGILGGGGGGGGLLGGILGGGGGGGLLVSVTALLNLFPGLGAAGGTDLVAELLDVVQGLVGTLTGILPDAQLCACGRSAVLRQNVEALLEANKEQLGPIRIR